MAPTHPKNTNASPKQTSRQAAVQRKRQLADRKASLAKKGAENKKAIKKLKADLTKAQKQLEKETDEDTRSAIEESLKGLMAKCKEKETELEQNNAELEQMDTTEDVTESPKDMEDGSERDDSGTEDEGDPPNSEAENRTMHSNTIAQEAPNSEISDTTSISRGSLENPADPSTPAGTNDTAAHDDSQEHRDPPNLEGPSTPAGSDDTAAHNDPQEHGVSPSLEGFPGPAGTQGAATDNLQEHDGILSSVENEEIEAEPQSFNECIPAARDLRTNEHSKFSIDNGTVILMAREGKLFLNKYGPRNSAVHIWSGTPAAYTVQEMTSLHGLPHKEAMSTDDLKGGLKWKLKLGPIRSVAWKPKQPGESMIHLLESVEELNPANKKIHPRYVYPFSTAFVDLLENGNAVSTVCISRSDYKRLSKGGKESHAKIDSRFYNMASIQVQNYRDWAGKGLDPTWDGKRRMGRESQSIPPYATPAPKLADRSETLVPATPAPTASNSPSQANSVTDNLSQRATSQSSLSSSEKGREGGSMEDSEDTAPISDFYDAFLMKKDFDSNTQWKDLDDATFAAFLASVKVYIGDLKKNNVNVFDDMGFGKILKI